MGGLWTALLAIVLFLSTGSTKSTASYISRPPAVATARSGVIIDSATGRQELSPPPGLAAAVAARSAPREAARRSLRGHQASSETPAAAPWGRPRRPLMLVNRDGEPHSLASALPARRTPGGVPGRGEGRETNHRRQRGRRSLLSLPTIGAGQVLVGLAGGSDAPLTTPTPRLTASAFLVQFSEIGGRTTRVVGAGGGAAAAGEGTENEGQRRPQQQRGPGPDQRRVQQQRHDQESRLPERDPEPIQLSGAPEQGGHRHQGTAATSAQGSTAVQLQRPTAVIDTGPTPQHVLVDSDRPRMPFPIAGQSPIGSQYDPGRTQQTAASVTVTESVHPQSRPAPPDQHYGYQDESPDQTQRYCYQMPDQTLGFIDKVPDQEDGYKNETTKQSEGYNYKTQYQAEGYEDGTSDRTEGYSSEIPDQTDGYNNDILHQTQEYGNQEFSSQVLDETQGYASQMPDRNQGYSRSPDQRQITRTELQTTQDINAQLTRTSVFTAPHIHADGSISSPSASNTVSGAIPVKPARPFAGVTRYNPSSVSSESTPAGDIRPGQSGGHWPNAGRVGNGREQRPTSPGRRAQSEVTGNTGQPALDPIQAYSGWQTDALSAKKPVSVSTVSPGVASVVPSGFGGAGIGTSNVHQAGSSGYNYDPPSEAETELKYDPPSDGGSGYRYDSSASSDTGYQYNPPSILESQSASNAGYQYSPPSTNDTAFQYHSPSISDAGYQLDLSVVSNFEHQYNSPSSANTGHQNNPPSNEKNSVSSNLVPEYHIDHWHKPRQAPTQSHVRTSPSYPDERRLPSEQTVATPSAAPPQSPVTGVGPSTARPVLSYEALRPSTAHSQPSSAGLSPSTARPQQPSAGLGPSIARPQPSSAGLGPSTVRPQPPSAGLNPSTVRPQPDAADSSLSLRPEFPVARLGISPSPRGLMWPVLDVLERTLAAQLVFSATTSEPDGVVVHHRGTARPPTQQPRRRRRRAELPADDRSAMQHALAMVAALSPGTGTGQVAMANDTASVTPQTDVQPSPLPLQPAPAVWPPPGEELQPTPAVPVPADPVSAPVSTADRHQQSGSGVLPAPQPVTYPDLRPGPGQAGVEMELDPTADGTALWIADPRQHGNMGSLLDQFPFEPGKTRDQHGKLGLHGVKSAFGSDFFNSFPDKPFPLKDVVIPDFYFVDEFDGSENSIESGDSIENRSWEPKKSLDVL